MVTVEKLFLNEEVPKDEEVPEDLMQWKVVLLIALISD